MHEVLRVEVACGLVEAGVAPRHQTLALADAAGQSVALARSAAHRLRPLLRKEDFRRNFVERLGADPESVDDDDRASYLVELLLEDRDPRRTPLLRELKNLASDEAGCASGIGELREQLSLPDPSTTIDAFLREMGAVALAPAPHEASARAPMSRLAGLRRS